MSFITDDMRSMKMNKKKILELLKHPSGIPDTIFNGCPLLLCWMSDKSYLKLRYRWQFKKKLDLKNPQTFNEKLQWLKLNDRNPEYTRMVDKYEAKKYVAEIIGEEYVIPTLGVWDKFDDIDFDTLPNQFVLKCTHDSGGLVIVKDKNLFDVEAAKRKINKCLRKNFFWLGREWPYKNVKPRIIAEQYIVDESRMELKDFKLNNPDNPGLNDYKFFCFNGVVKCFKVDFDRFIEHHANYYDENNKLLYFGELVCPPCYNRKIKMPSKLETMKLLAEKLSKSKTFLRVDFYSVGDKIYFGELTFFPASGFGSFTSEEFDNALGKYILLPNWSSRRFCV